jgi:hypothetical protein
MKATRLVGAATTAVLFGFGGGCTDGGTVLEPAAPAASVQSPPPQGPAPRGNPRILASGVFVSVPDFVNATLTPQGNHCIVEIGGELTFFGTLEGGATGTSTVRVFAACSEVELPGALEAVLNVFRSEGVFDGTVDGEQVRADFVYQGRAEEGGRVQARFHFSGGLQGVLHVEGEAGRGGTYEGFVIRR